MRASRSLTLLEIKSPASESLLTINDAGDLWIKGHLYDYAFQLNRGTQYSFPL